MLVRGKSQPSCAGRATGSQRALQSGRTRSGTDKASSAGSRTFGQGAGFEHPHRNSGKPTPVSAGVAQLVEHLFCKQEVRGSSPLPSSSFDITASTERKFFGGLPEWPMGAGCKPAGVSLRWFESNTLHHMAEMPQQ